MIFFKESKTFYCSVLRENLTKFIFTDFRSAKKGKTKKLFVFFSSSNYGIFDK